MFITACEQPPLVAAIVAAHKTACAFGEISAQDYPQWPVEFTFGSKTGPPVAGPVIFRDAVDSGYLPVDERVLSPPPPASADTVDCLATELGIRRENESESIGSGGCHGHRPGDQERKDKQCLIQYSKHMFYSTLASTLPALPPPKSLKLWCRHTNIAE
jgi:hypothetical protein